MNQTIVDYFRRAQDSSRVIRAMRPVVADSVLCRSAGSVVRWCLQIRRRIVAGLGGGWTAADEAVANQRLDAMMSTSRLVAALASLGTRIANGWRHGVARRLVFGPLLAADLPRRVQLVAIVLLSAVVSHAALSTALGVGAGRVGWSMRAGLCLLAAAAYLRPDVLAAAWRDRVR